MSIIEDDFELQYNLDYIRSNDKDAYDKYRQDVKKKRVELSVWTLPTLKQYKEKEEERIRDFSVKPYYIVKGIVPCAKCKCDEMMTFQVQSRGMDEGMTAIYVCTKCQHTFSMS